ncbi:hypothetical protein [Costertonia aggregata]|uniref:Uncharacterized protein n=1 Tax=Costertonia aggregata TaxID=343403 RepID=A0A7H9ASY0_9FLAO|nr:hypothetical protein [Costertonia aggregata]QLG46550.1 hypothetical protein HYG79_14740 [Costertonia aggregata]
MKKIALAIVAALLLFGFLVFLSIRETSEEFRTCEILNIADVEKRDFREYDSVLVAANSLYDADWVKRFMQGEQYRDAWGTPVQVPIIFLDTLLGGLKVIEEGGGMQTHSLEVEDPLGIRYTFRSITKDPTKLIPDIARDLGLENVVVDGISAQHPYASVPVAKLAEYAKIVHTHPKIYFVPKQSQLGEYNEKYGNRLYLFEYESEGAVNWTPFENILEILDTEDVQEWKMEGKPITVDKSALIRARLFDLIIGDWDRHAKQWGWAVEQKSDSLVAHPIPADRDNAFFKLEGVLPTIISNDILLPEMQTFEKDIEYMPGLVRPFDVYFLKGVSLEQFIEESKFLQVALTNTAIMEAFKVWPQAIKALNGKEIIEKLKARRDGIVDYAKNFHRILDERPLEPLVLKGSENLEMNESMAKCFDCLD